MPSPLASPDTVGYGRVEARPIAPGRARMRGLPLGKRLQLVKLLRARGLRDLERLREDELRDALAELARLSPSGTPESTFMTEHPSSSELLRAHAAFPATPQPDFDADFDDPHALPRFREPKLHLPDEQRTFLRAIAVKPGLLFFTWDVARATRESLKAGVELWIFAYDFLGAPPARADVLRLDPVERLPIELSAGGWYLPTTRERSAIGAALVETTSPPRRIVESNLALCPPSRPAPPGPLWMATLPPSVDRRRLGQGVLLQALEGGPLPEGALLRREGEAEPGEWAEGDLPASAARMRAQRFGALRTQGLGVSTSNPSSHSNPSSGTLPSSHSFRSGGVS